MRNIVSTNKVEMVKTQVDGKRSSVLVLKKSKRLGTKNQVKSVAWEQRDN